MPDFSEEEIKALVRVFYADVRADDMLAPIFATKIPADHWDHHEAHIADFWSSVLRGSRRFKGNPMMKHMALNGLTPAHFTHWLDLFLAAAQRRLTAEQAEHIHTTAKRIAASLQMGLAVHYSKTDADNPFKDHASALRQPAK